MNKLVYTTSSGAMAGTCLGIIRSVEGVHTSWRGNTTTVIREYMDPGAFMALADRLRKVGATVTMR